MNRMPAELSLRENAKIAKTQAGQPMASFALLALLYWRIALFREDFLGRELGFRW